MKQHKSPPLPSPDSNSDVFTWTGFEQDLIQATLDFANMEGPPLAKDVEDLFWPFTRDFWVPSRPEEKNTLLGTVRYQRGPWFVPQGSLGPSVRGDRPVSSNVAGLTRPRVNIDPDGCEKHRDSPENLQKWWGHFRVALTDIVGGAAIDESFQRFAEETLEGMPFRLGVVDGVLVFRFSIETVAAGWSLGYMMLRNSDYLLRSCPECDKFFAIFDPKKRARLYCSDCAPEVERRLANERQLRYRRKKRGK